MTRPAYDTLPEPVRAWVDTVLGSPVVEWTGESGGFSPGVAARVACADGTRAFVKAASGDVNPATPDMHRTEARVTGMLPASLGGPRLLASYDDGTWVALVLEQVDGRPPALPWRADELRAALRALDRLAQVPAPAGVPKVAEVLGERFTGWRSLAANAPADLEQWQRERLDQLVAHEARWPDAAAGDRLLHVDVRADNMLVTTSGEVVLVDWPWAAAGDPLLDVVAFVPSAVLTGAGDPEALLRSTAAGRAAAPEQVTALVVAVAGLMEAACRQPPPPGMPTVREHQAAQARAAGAWLRQRTGW